MKNMKLPHDFFYANETLSCLVLKTLLAVTLNRPLFFQVWIFAGDFIEVSGRKISGNDEKNISKMFERIKKTFRISVLQ